MRLLLPSLPLRSPLVELAVLALLSNAVQAQSEPGTPAPPPTPAPAQAPVPAPTPAPTQAPGAANARPSAPAAAPGAAPARPGAQPADLQRVQITGSTAADADTLQRQQSTASKIIIGREEIDRYGDSNLGEVLKRLPGVTSGGAPGRGGPPRMRGMGGGYTQILINGEPIPQGFSLESLTPEQVERIEILRAPTAEFGARAIAGTINVVLREALQKRLNDLRFGAGTEGGLVSPGISWTRNDKLGDAPGSAYNLSVSAFQRRTEDQLFSRRTLTDIDTGRLRQEQFETGQSRDERMGLNISGRLQWRLGEGESLTLQPVIFLSKGENTTERTLVQPVTLKSAAPYAQANSRADSEFGVARLNAQWQKKLGTNTRLELRLGGGGYRAENQLLRNEYDANGRLIRVLDESTVARESSVTSVGKLSHELASEHSLVSGWDIEAIQRNETRVTLPKVNPLLVGFGNELEASSRRIALYVQDEWSPNKQWSAYAGLRWERIATESKDVNNPVSQSNAVWTPLFQALWKPNEKSRDQVRMALTRSYKAPTLRNLIARPYLSNRFPVPGPNEASSPDVVGNPLLKPELATGVDLAFEHYLPAGGLLSVNLFHRQISNLIRNVTSLQTVTWGVTDQRFVSQPQNVGDAMTQGIELEAKGRLSEMNKDWPGVNLRSNLSLFRSRVKGVPGPDNRIDEQAAATANLGADHRFRGLPFTLGASYNWTPAYEVQQTATQRLSFSTKRSFEAFGTWDVSPALKLRLGATNLRPLAYSTQSSIDRDNLRDTNQDIARGRTQWSLRVEMKL